MLKEEEEEFSQEIMVKWQPKLHTCCMKYVIYNFSAS